MNQANICQRRRIVVQKQEHRALHNVSLDARKKDVMIDTVGSRA